jgi:hypothetical protein
MNYEAYHAILELYHRHCDISLSRPALCSCNRIELRADRHVKSTTPTLVREVDYTSLDPFLHFCPLRLVVDHLGQDTSTPDFTPTDQPPVLVDPPTQRDLLALFTTCRCSQLDRDVSALDCLDTTSCLGCTDVDKQGFTDDEF